MKVKVTSTRSTAPKRGDITKSGQLWHYGEIRRSISTGAIYNGILFYSDFSGFLHALDAKSGKQLWKHDMFAAIWGSPIVIDGKVFLGDEDGDVTILNADKALKVVAENNMGSSVYSTATPANGVIYIVNRNQLVAVAETRNGDDGDNGLHSGGTEEWRRTERAALRRLRLRSSAVLRCLRPLRSLS